jgi:hypothetical protein
MNVLFLYFIYYTNDLEILSMAKCLMYLPPFVNLMCRCRQVPAKDWQELAYEVNVRRTKTEIGKSWLLKLKNQDLKFS